MHYACCYSDDYASIVAIVNGNLFLGLLKTCIALQSVSRINFASLYIVNFVAQTSLEVTRLKTWRV